MFVIKRDGRKETVFFDKITSRIQRLCYGLDPKFVDPIKVSQSVVQGVYPGVTTKELDELASETAASKVSEHPDYGLLAGRIAVSNLQKSTLKSFSATCQLLYDYVEPKTGKHAPLISKDLQDFVQVNADKLNSAIVYDRDFSYDYFGFKTLEKSYLFKINGNIVERPQHMLMRVACGIHCGNLEAAIETYNLVSLKFFTHASPTLFNAGTPHPQLSSCFVAGTKVHTMDGVKNIQDVDIGDFVVTHEGNVRMVKQVHKNPIGERQLFRIRPSFGPEITVTENHRFWSISQEQFDWERDEACPRWNRADYLRSGDWIAIPKRTNSSMPIITSEDGTLVWEFDADICKLLGIWVRHGMFLGDNLKECVQFDWTSDSELLAFIESTGEKHFGTTAGKHHRFLDDGSQETRLFFHSDAAVNILGRLFFTETGDVRLPASFQFLGEKEILAFAGELDTCKWTECQRVDECILQEVFHLARSVGIVASIYKSSETGEAYFYLVPSDNELFLEWKGTKFVQISSKKPFVGPAPQIVYTLGVDKDHSYSVEGVLAENCFLLTMKEDSIEGIYDTLKQCAIISKHAGGIGLAIHNIRATGSYIRGTNGSSNGLIPMIRVFNNTARYVDQCFTADTMVYSSVGPKPISEVTTSDKLLTSTGKFSPVKRVLKQLYAGDILCFQLDHAIDQVHVTPQHQLLIVKCQDKNSSTIVQRLDKGFLNMEWTDAKDVQPGDFVVFPVPQLDSSLDITHLSNDDCRFYGILLGSGHFDRLGNVSFTVDATASKFVQKYCFDRGFKFFEKENYQYSFSELHPLFAFSKSQVINSDGETCIDPALLMLPEQKLLNILLGLIESCGKYIPYKNEVSLNVHRFSRTAVESLRFLLIRLGSFCRYDNGNLKFPCPKLLNVFLGHQVNCCNEVDSGIVRYKDNLLVHVSDISLSNKSSTSEVVYDFDIAGDDHTYVTHMGVAHNGGGKRKGAFAMYLEPWHSDIMSFLELKKNMGVEEERARDLFYALWISDLFMERVKADADWSLFCPNEAPGLSDCYGEDFKALYQKYEQEGKARQTIKARSLWNVILQSQIETGTPYFLYKDASNKKSNQKNLGTIKSSNLCVHGETKILTSAGYFPIKDLVNTQVQVWNGAEFSSTEVKQTGVNQALVTVKISNGLELKCTPYHKFYIKQDSQTVVMEAQHLQPGMPLIPLALPVINFQDEFPFAYTHGLYCAESTKSDTPGHMTLGNSTQNMVVRLENTTCNFNKEWNCWDVTLQDGFHPKHFVPINFSIRSKVKWLEGLFDADGKSRDGKIFIATPRYDFVRDISLLLQTMGLECNIQEDLQDLVYRLLISDTDLVKLYGFGFCPKKFQIPFLESFGSRPNTYTVVEVQNASERADTYCFNEPLLHRGVFNGIVTSQCSEILQYTSPEEVAVCNLASISLPAFLSDNLEFDHTRLYQVTQTITKNLNQIIDINLYPVPEAERSNKRHRPIGIGIQGMADTFARLKLPFESAEARKLNREIFETIYFAALSASCELSKQLGPYESFKGSPASDGKLQFDLWEEEGKTKVEHSGRWDWENLKEEIKQHGLRNSLLVAPMPTASTSQILGNNESFEPFTSNMYVRRTLAGEFVCVNKYLLKDLIDRGLWNNDLKQKIIAHNGSVQMISDVPSDLKELYKTAYEIPGKVLVEMAAERGVYIDQSQSLNVFMDKVNIAKLTSYHFAAWQKGLKTGMYYLRTKPAADPIKFTIDHKTAMGANNSFVSGSLNKTEAACALDNPEACEACSA